MWHYPIVYFGQQIKDELSALFVYKIAINSTVNFSILKHGSNEVIDLVWVYFCGVNNTISNTYYL